MTHTMLIAGSLIAALICLPFAFDRSRWAPVAAAVAGMNLLLAAALLVAS